MSINKIIRPISIFLLMFCISCSSASTENNSAGTEQGKTAQSEKIDSILEKLNKKTGELKSYQCQLEFKYVQPSVFDTQTLRKGILYYSKQDNKSKFRVNFQTLKQDEEAEKKFNEQYIIVDGSELPKSGTKFEGLWLIQLDYENKNCKYIQLTDAGEPNKPVDVFDLVSTKLPMVGFTKTDRLKEQFDISLPEKKKGESEELVQVQLKVKPNSVYKDKYVQIDCWIDEKLNLPVKIAAISVEPEGVPGDQKDFYEIKFTKAQVNEKIELKIFDFQIPKDFDEPEIFPLKN